MRLESAMKPLNPVMAAFLAASSVVVASPGIAFANCPTPDCGVKKTPALTAMTAQAPADDGGHAQAIRDMNFVMPRLIALVAGKPEARKDIGERLAKFIKGKGAGKQYLTDGLLKDKTLLKAAVAVAKDWPEKSQGEPGKVAALYFVVGPGSEKLPAWEPAEFKGKFKPKMEWSGRLAAALKSAHWSDTKQVAQGDAANGTVALLDDAAGWAQKILDEVRTKEDVGESANNNATGAVVPGAGGSDRKPTGTIGAESDFDDLYVKGAAKPADIYGPDDDGFRTIAMKI